jgi:hypothetical protein
MSASVPLPRHIRKLRQIRRSAWLAILLSTALQIAGAAIGPAIAANPTPSFEMEKCS